MFLPLTENCLAPSPCVRLCVYSRNLAFPSLSKVSWRSRLAIRSLSISKQALPLLPTLSLSTRRAASAHALCQEIPTASRQICRTMSPSLQLPAAVSTGCEEHLDPTCLPFLKESLLQVCDSVYMPFFPLDVRARYSPFTPIKDLDYVLQFTYFNASSRIVSLMCLAGLLLSFSMENCGFLVPLVGHQCPAAVVQWLHSSCLCWHVSGSS